MKVVTSYDPGESERTVSRLSLVFIAELAMEREPVELNHLARRR
jgi:hypothetical protein